MALGGREEILRLGHHCNQVDIALLLLIRTPGLSYWTLCSSFVYKINIHYEYEYVESNTLYGNFIFIVFSKISKDNKQKSTSEGKSHASEEAH